MDGHSSAVTRPPGVPPKVAGFRFWLLALVVLPTLANNYTFELLSIIVTPIKDHYRMFAIHPHHRQCYVLLIMVLFDHRYLQFRLWLVIQFL